MSTCYVFSILKKQLSDEEFISRIFDRGSEDKACFPVVGIWKEGIKITSETGKELKRETHELI